MPTKWKWMSHRVFRNTEAEKLPDCYSFLVQKSYHTTRASLGSMKLCFKQDDIRWVTFRCEGRIKMSFAPLPSPMFTHEIVYEKWLLECWLWIPVSDSTIWRGMHEDNYIHNCRNLSSGFLSTTVQHCKTRRPAVLQLPYHKWAQSYIFSEIRMWSFTEHTIKLWNSQCCRGQKQNNLHNPLKKFMEEMVTKGHNYMDRFCSSGTH